METKAMRMWMGCALSALSGALLTLSFAPSDHWWLIWVALIPLLIARYRVLPPDWSALGPAIGVGGFTLGYFGGVFPAAAAWYMKALPALVAGVILLTARGGRADRDRRGYAFWPVAGATAWVASELLRMFIPALGTWGFLGYALYRQPWLIQPVRWVGIFGLDLLIVLVNHALAMAAIAWLDRRGLFEAPVIVRPQHAARWCAAALGILTIWCGFALLVERSAGGSTVRVAALQPGVRRGDVGLTPEARDRGMLDRLAAQTRQAAAGGARLVVWPEAALAVDPAINYRSELASLARATGTTLVVAYAMRTPAGLRNEAVTVEPDGTFVGRYGKDHPVGFLGGTSVSRGTYPTVAAHLGGAETTLATMICADGDFTDTGRKLAHNGAKVIALPSADWPAIASKHYTLSIFRALETGAALVKSEYKLDSVIVDGYGRIVASAVTPAGAPAVLVADVPLRAGLPLAVRLGDWVGWLCVAGLIVRALWSLRRARQAAPVESTSMAAEPT